MASRTNCQLSINPLEEGSPGGVKLVAEMRSAHEHPQGGLLHLLLFMKRMWRFTMAHTASITALEYFSLRPKCPAPWRRPPCHDRKPGAPRFIHLAAEEVSDIMQQHAQGQLQEHGGAVLPNASASSAYGRTSPSGCHWEAACSRSCRILRCQPYSRRKAVLKCILKTCRAKRNL